MGIKKLCVALVAIALGAVTAAPASAAPEGNRPEGNKVVEISNVRLGLCLEHSQSSNRPSIVKCTGGAAQQFERVPAATGGEFLRNVAGGTCLDRMHQSIELLSLACNAEEASQRLEVVPTGTSAVKLRFQGRVAQVRYPDLGVLFLEDVWPEADLWEIREVGIASRPEPAPVVRLRNADRQTCVTENDISATMQPCTATTGQKFERVDLGAGRTGLRSTTSDTCLANLRFGRVTLETCSATNAAQQWTLRADELGNYKIANESSAQHLTPTSDGGVAAYPYWEIGLAQQWQLVAG